jgi:prepilin-type N-terminal cleavage/methylation domain-containing protein
MNIKKQSGFSLVEVIIAIFLVGAIILVIANIPYAIRLITASQTESLVREAVAKKLEDLRLTGYDNLATGNTTFTDARLNKLSGILAATNVIDCPVMICPSGEAAKQVTISVSWSENNSPKSFKIMTLISKGGLK